MSEQDSELPQVLFGQIADDREIDAFFQERSRLRPKPERPQPLSNVPPRDASEMIAHGYSPRMPRLLRTANSAPERPASFVQPAAELCFRPARNKRSRVASSLVLCPVLDRERFQGRQLSTGY